MVSGGRHRRYGPGTGGVAVDVDNIISRLGNIQRQIDDMTDTTDMDPASGANIGAPEPDNPFKVGKRTKKGGEVPSLAFRIDKNTTSVKVQLIAENEIGTNVNLARQAIKEYEFEVSEDEAASGFVKREFAVPLNFLTTYFCTRLVATLVKDGSIVQARNPALNPYQTIAGFVPIPIKNPDGTPTNPPLKAQFTTCDSTGTNCPDATQTIGTLAAGQTPNVKFVGTSDFKSTDTGVRTTMHLTIPSTADTVKVVLYPLGASEVFDSEAANAESLEDVFEVTNKERTNGKLDRRFGKKLEYAQRYKLIRLVARGDNVGGPGIDIVKVPTNTTGTVPDVGNAGASAEFTTPGVMGVVESTAVRPSNPFVDVTPNPNNNNLPDKGFKIKARGVKALLQIIIPSTAFSVKCRIAAQEDVNANKLNTLSDEWDDITDAERAAGLIIRQFGPTLDFSTSYSAVQFVADGANIGGDGINKIRNPLRIPNPITAVMGGTFTTCNRDGTFTPVGTGALSFLGKTGTRSKKNGVIAKLRYEVPVGTKTLTVKIQNTRDSADPTKRITATFEDIETTGGGPNGGRIFEEEFPIKLDAGTTQLPETYGVIRLIAEGPMINADLQDSANPDVVRNPKAQPAAGVYIGTFTTAPALGFGNETVPSIPRQATDLSNGLENDAPKVLWTIFATEDRNATGQGGSGPNGQITFSDVGATDALVIAKRDTDASNADPLKFGGPISDLNATSALIELNGLVFGKQYQILRNILTAGADRAIQVAPTPILFRAGGSINLTDLSLLPFPNNTKRFAITELLGIAPNETLVRTQYLEGSSAVLARKIKILKRVQGKTADFRAQSEIVLRDDSNNFTPGLKTFDFTINHPAGAIIDVQASLIALQGGFPSQLDDFRLNVATDQLPGVTDVGRPQFSGRRSDGGSNASPFKLPDMRVRWRSTGIRVRMNKPDVNMFSFDRNILFFVFQGSRIVGGLFDQFTYYYNPNTDAVSSRFTIDPFLSPTDSTFGVDLGQAAGDFFPVMRPNFADAGELPSTIYNDLVNFANTPGASARFFVRYFVLNRTTAPISPPGLLNVPNNALLVTSLPDSFPFGGLFQEGSVS